MSLVSVIIATFNRWDMLKRAVESVLNQTYNNIECIVVDDCSTDSEYLGKDPLTKLLDPSIYDLSSLTMIRLEENMGKKHNMICAQGMTRNEGLKLAKGKYIAFIDDDD